MIKTPKRPKNNGNPNEVAKPESAKPAITNLTKPMATTANHISLELVKPEAKQVCVAGSFNEWKPEKTPLMRAGNGRWGGGVSSWGRGGERCFFFVEGALVGQRST